MKIGAVNLNQILDNHNVGVNVKKNNSSSDNNFEELLNKTINNNHKKQSTTTKESRDIKEEREPEVSEGKSSKDDEKVNLQGAVDCGLLLKLLTYENISEEDLNGLTANINLSKGELTIKGLIDLLSNLSGSQGTIPSEIDNLLSQDNSSINSLIKLINEKLPADSKVQSAEAVSLLNEDDEIVQNNASLNQGMTETATDNQKSDTESDSSTAGEAETKEDKLLKSIANSDSKLENRTYAFPNHLSRLIDNPGSVQNVANNTSVNRNSLVYDVAKVIKYMNTNDMKELTIKITPHDLGELTIKISMEGNLLKASIAANNKDTYSLLNSSVAEIRNSLNNSEIRVQEVAINIYNEDTTFFSGNFENGRQQSEHGRGRKGSSSSISNIDNTDLLETSDNSYGLESNISILA